MIATHRLHVVTAACATTLLAGALAAVAFGTGSASAESADTSANTGSDGTTYNVLDMPSAQSGIALKDKAYSKDGPIVTELADGRFVQRTPSENISADYDAEGAYSHPAKNALYNCAYLKADERGQRLPRRSGRAAQLVQLWSHRPHQQHRHRHRRPDVH